MGSSIQSGEGDDLIPLDTAPITAIRDPACIRNLDASDRLFLEIDRERTGELTGELPVVDGLSDGFSGQGSFAEIRMGTVAVAHIDDLPDQPGRPAPDRHQKHRNRLTLFIAVPRRQPAPASWPPHRQRRPALAHDAKTFVRIIKISLSSFCGVYFDWVVS